MQRLDSRDDTGASLIFVLAFMVLVSVLALGALDLSQAGYSSTDAVRTSRQANYAADAALELAIKRIGDGATLPSSGQSNCFSVSSVDAQSATVDCAVSSTTSTGSTAWPQNALLTLSTSKPLTLHGTDVLGVSGNVYATDVINTASSSNNKLSVAGKVHTVNAADDSSDVCSDAGRVTATIKLCHQAATTDGADPGWSSESVNATAITSATCAGHDKVAVFSPGSFSASPVTLADNTASRATGCDSRTVSTLAFSPGVYSFATGVTFSPGQLNVVGGSFSSQSWYTGNTTPTASPDVCDQTASQGVQFILNGSATLDLTPTGAGNPFFALCANAATAAKPGIAIYSTATLASGYRVLSNSQENMYIHGVVYIPQSDLSAYVFNKARTYFNGGIVASSVVLSVSASSTQIDAPINLASCDPSLCTTTSNVVFTVSVGGRPRITSEVKFTTGSSPQIISWNNVT